jgi:REP element-mobilizing transposase RayT
MYHVLNRAVARMAPLENEADYLAFKWVLVEALQEHPTRLLSYTVMPNHGHVVLGPRHDGELTELVRWLTHTHVLRWHSHFDTSAAGTLIKDGSNRSRFRRTTTSIPNSVALAHHFARPGKTIRRIALAALFPADWPLNG